MSPTNGKRLEQVSLPVFSDITMMGCMTARQVHDRARGPSTHSRPRVPRASSPATCATQRQSCPGAVATPNMTATTDASGRYQIEIPSCDYSVTYSCADFTTFTKSTSSCSRWFSNSRLVENHSFSTQLILKKSKLMHAGLGLPRDTLSLVCRRSSRLQHKTRRFTDLSYEKLFFLLRRDKVFPS